MQYSGKPIRHTQKTDRKERLLLKYSTSDPNHLGKQVKCSARNHLGSAIAYAEIPGNKKESLNTWINLPDNMDRIDIFYLQIQINSFF